ncbi:hypothetical protein TKWG_22925 [Advenella kashmirensis WT001]|uniref:Uncharacterized protein n=1 Tax=Advenella kashmirensis (strain DSM 17095 / LMG 22695 / WT001) TaxID=1036672 RepID=I3UGR1_ADVKW|nr:hypothetical protein [Advenella kashmirensis]AFK64199.1 hypothetical protein TKWG_22925 [Advenella kashmirensis WT001]
MARGKRPKYRETIGIAAIGLLVFFNSIPREIWIVIGVTVAMGAVIYFYRNPEAVRMKIIKRVSFQFRRRFT